MAIGQSHDLNLVVVRNDRVNGGQFHVKIQIRKTPGSPDFLSGNFSQGVTFNPQALQIIGNASNVGSIGNAGRVWSAAFIDYAFARFSLVGQNNPVAPNTGVEISFGLAIDDADEFLNLVNVSDTWIDVITLRFNILDNTKKLNVDRLGPGNNVAAQQWARVVWNGTNWVQTDVAKGNFFDKVTYTAGTWVGGNGSNGMPNATDAAKELIMTSNGTTADTATLTGNVEVDYFEIPANCRLKLAAGATMRPFNQASNTYIHTQPTQFVLTADGSAVGVKYSQYIGPSIPGFIQQYVGTTEGWRNVSLPIASSSASANEFSLGGAPISFNTASTSYHTTPSTRDICGNFGGWINTVNVYTFTGATGSPQPHEWYGASNTIGGTMGYSVFLGSSFFPTNGIMSIKGNFNAGALSYSYAHSTPHALNTNGASQSLYAGGGTCNPAVVEVPADRKANWDGWALVANPYPSGLDVDQFALDNLLPASNVRVWNRGKAYDIVGGGGIDYQYESMEGKIIPPMQAFFVKVGSNNTSQLLTFNDGQRAFSSEGFLKTPPEHIKLIAMNVADSAINHAILAFDPSATNAYDIEFDSYVLSQPGNTRPQIGFHNEYVTNGQTVVAPLYVSTVSEPLQTGSYPVRFWSRTHGNFSFRIDQDVLNPNWLVYVEDTKVAPGVSHNITNQSYNFSYTHTDAPTRFILHYVNKAFGVDINTANTWQVTGHFAQSSDLVLHFNGTNLPTTARVIVYDVMGKLLYSKENVETTNQVSIENNYAAGLYIVAIEGNNGQNRMVKVVKGN
jgi:hypothetical protein